MSTNIVEEEDSDGQLSASRSNVKSVYAALARTLTRGAALYFSRPVRLFRPSKVSGWMTLNSLASQNNVSLSPRFLTDLVKRHGVGVLSRHFIPPLAINALLGTVLWTCYSVTSSSLEGHVYHPYANAAISGAVAGGVQALVAAPAENVRMLLEGSTYSGWSSAWKSVFMDTRDVRTIVPESKRQILEQARDMRRWMKEAGEIAGRGWQGWGWGFSKDVCGFAAFFTIFEFTRRVALRVRDSAEAYLTRDALADEDSKSPKLPRIAHGVTLVGGGVFAGLAYDFIGRPFDVGRRAVHSYEVTRDLGVKSRITFAEKATNIVLALSEKLKVEGLRSFLRLSQDEKSASALSTPWRQRLYSTLRILGRVGPWGAGFLIWESFGPGLLVASY